MEVHKNKQLYIYSLFPTKLRGLSNFRTGVGGGVMKGMFWASLNLSPQWGPGPNPFGEQRTAATEFWLILMFLEKSLFKKKS